MKAELMTALGLDDGLATRAVGTLPPSELATLVNYANANPKAAMPLGSALPQLLKGDNVGALITACSCCLTGKTPAEQVAEAAEAEAKAAKKPHAEPKEEKAEEHAPHKKK